MRRLRHRNLLSSRPVIPSTNIISTQEDASRKAKSAWVYCHGRCSSQKRLYAGSSAYWKTFSTATSTGHPRHNFNNKIAVAMSGGVDSSVVAYLLTQQYPIHDLLGVHMSNWDYADEDPSENTTAKSHKNNSYCWEQDWKDATAVAKHLKIPLHHVSFQSEYWNEVFQPYCQKLSQSITPNPDVDCNRYIKFGVLKSYLEKRFANEVDYLATGHYARIWDRSRSSSDYNSTSVGYRPGAEGMPSYLRRALDEEESSVLADYILHPSAANTPLLLSARDRSKDQSYFLSGVSAKAFSSVLFPLGDYYKKEPGTRSIDAFQDLDSETAGGPSVRQVAQNAQLPNATKRDSVGICFIGKRKHGEFINEYVDHPLEDDERGGDASSSSDSGMVQCINVENHEVVATFDPSENPALLYATIGQGAKLSGAAQKWFLVDKELQPPGRHDPTKTLPKWKSPRIFLCPGTHHPSLYADTFFVRSREFNWIAGGEENRPPPLPFRAKCRIRHLQPLVDCEITRNEESHAGDYQRLEVRLDTPLRGIAPGQVCVVYAGGSMGDLICLGGGPIDRAGPNYWELQRDLPKVLHPSGHNDASVL